jgi:undecaprenyl-diphosphatase
MLLKGAPMPPGIAALLGVVEGLTEYLPVSSTGHLLLAGHLLGLNDEDPATSSFEIVVQLGAILAVVAHYRRLLADKLRGVTSGDAASLRLLAAIAIAFAPAAVVGLLLRKTIKALLFRPWPVAGALIVGGIAMIAIERWLARRRPSMPSEVSSSAREVSPRPSQSSRLGGLEGLDNVTAKRALAIGLGQCFSLWPGTSRSMCTIVAGQLVGLSTATAAEFSFLLALPTLGAATLFEAYKARTILASHVGPASMTIGLVVSFLVAWAVIATFLKYLRSNGLEPFGWYRIVVGLVVFWALSQ